MLTSLHDVVFAGFSCIWPIYYSLLFVIYMKETKAGITFVRTSMQHAWYVRQVTVPRLLSFRIYNALYFCSNSGNTNMICVCMQTECLRVFYITFQSFILQNKLWSIHRNFVFPGSMVSKILINLLDSHNFYAVK